MIRTRLCLIASAFAAAILGCSTGNPNTPASVSGKVTYKGKPVTAGTITFHPKEGGVYPQGISPDGTYAAPTLPAGEMTITVDTESANLKNQPTYGPPGGGGKGMPAGYIPEGAPTPQAGGAYVKIPEKYAKKESSPLTVTLTAGKQEKDFALTD